MRCFSKSADATCSTARAMTPERMEKKLAQIARATAAELDGWEAAIAQFGREYFDGEKAAIVNRRTQLAAGKDPGKWREASTR